MHLYDLHSYLIQRHPAPQYAAEVTCICIFIQRLHQFPLICHSTPAVTCRAIPHSASSDLHLCCAAPKCPADGGPGVAHNGLTNTTTTAVPAYFFDSETSTRPQSLSTGSGLAWPDQTLTSIFSPRAHTHDMAIAGRRPTSMCAPRACARSKPQPPA